MTHDIIVTDRVAPPVGPYSLGVVGKGLIFLSGQVALDPATGELISGDAAEQTQRILDNLASVLDATGKSFRDVVRVGIYLTDMSDFAAVNAVYASHFSEPYPARTTIAVAALPLGATVEIDLIAG